MLRTKLKEELFKFKKHPKITKEINEVLKQYYNSLLYTIESGTAKEWDFANEKMNAVQTLQLQRIASKVPKEVLVSELAKISKSPHNYEALKSFQQRKIGDFTISERVWKITEQMRDELEFAIDVSLADGKSANQLAREIKKYLNEPDRLYRRVRDKHGNLVLSQNAKNFHPGQGVYRSSHKNALRLAKEEINTAYRESEQLRIMQNNDVVGIEIKLSPSHKIYDICDELKGRYPKDFKWSKWHIGCMCHRITILKSDEEFIKELQNGENLPPESSKNFVSDVPKNFTQWVEDNEDRFKNWKRKPNFLEENKRYTNNKAGRVTYSENYDPTDFKRNKYVAEICAKDTKFHFHIREHVDIPKITNPEYLVNGKYLADRKSIESNKGIVTQIDGAKKQMKNKFINPNGEPYFIVWDLDFVKDLDWSLITHNLSKKITKERGTSIKGMFFQYKGKAVYLSREDIVDRKFNKLNLIK